VVTGMATVATCVAEGTATGTTAGEGVAGEGASGEGARGAGATNTVGEGAAGAMVTGWVKGEGALTYAPVAMMRCSASGGGLTRFHLGASLPLHVYTSTRFPELNS